MATEVVTFPEAAMADRDPHSATLGRAWEWDRLRGEREAALAQAQALTEANRRMEDFLGIAAHELKTPMASSSATLALATRRMHDLMELVAARERTSDAELIGQLTTLQGLLFRTEGSLGRLTRMLIDLLDVSRIRSDRFELRLAYCNLAAVVEEAVEEARQIAPARAIRLHLPVTSSVPVLADPDRIRQVVFNYLTNALRYSPADRPVDVHFQVQGYQVRVTVHDAGPGLPCEEQQRIWERFRRAAAIPAVSDTGVGLGLGLHICKTIVEQHQGRVGVRSAPGRGSTFWFALAVAGPEPHRLERTGDP
jgi:signal transduction histidine kinase